MKFLVIILLSIFLVGCTKSKDEVDVIIFTNSPEIAVEIFENSPGNDPNVYDRYDAGKILPEQKLNKTYKYKYYIKGYFDYRAYLKNRREDAVITSGSSPGVFTARIYSDKRIIYSDL